MANVYQVLPVAANSENSGVVDEREAEKGLAAFVVPTISR